MTSPDPGPPRPTRVAGVALLGLAAVALIIGLITALGGNGDGQADGNHDQPTQTTKPSGTTTSGKPTTRPPSSKSSSVSPPTTTTTATGRTSSGQTPPPGDGNGESTKTVPVRILNNSKIQGLAAKAEADLKADGWNVTAIGPYSATNVPTTTVYYRPGNAEEEATARAIATEFGLAVEPRLATLKNEPAGVIVIVTREYGATNGDGKNDG
jgi:MYXO-CTERM domain-containing protein